MSQSIKNPCPDCGKEMKCVKIPEIGSPHVGVCPDCGKQYVDCDTSG